MNVSILVHASIVWLTEACVNVSDNYNSGRLNCVQADDLNKVMLPHILNIDY